MTELNSITVTLAGTKYTISQLTLGQLMDLSVGVVLPDTPDEQENVRRSFRRSVGVIATGVGAANPELTLEKLFTMSISREEMKAATDEILRFAGLIPASTPTGEAVAAAAAAAASTGDSSSAA